MVGLVGAPVVEGHGDLGLGAGARHDVVVGQHVALAVDDHAGALAAARVGGLAEIATTLGDNRGRGGGPVGVVRVGLVHGGGVRAATQAGRGARSGGGLRRSPTPAGSRRRCRRWPARRRAPRRRSAPPSDGLGRLGRLCPAPRWRGRGRPSRGLGEGPERAGCRARSGCAGPGASPNQTGRVSCRISAVRSLRSVPSWGSLPADILGSWWCVWVICAALLVRLLRPVKRAKVRGHWMLAESSLWAGAPRRSRHRPASARRRPAPGGRSTMAATMARPRPLPPPAPRLREGSAR